ncbi:hypothetical protein QQS45_00190 [Alteriqipengyuania flavescens]|uniref:hypothetical protein n=1 Tax=Alteriqipengyuania flavescens TaxID=3053610 RepID=UPI0025B571D3|nr:hypothetical protein [Alteriqipengyuania flavescens]WJY18709.1 hypothetical protein QQW98_00190 [Alteriqipengyuania flavescens]WJY24649.1 hypothetical protein QQS45_00190 [Alteriqipengyuania flavescens]
MEPVRRVVGRVESGPGDLPRLAAFAAVEARELGFEVGRISVSRSASFSQSRYFTAVDVRGNGWNIRVADHHRPFSSSYQTPHFDLVSLDGRSGLCALREFLLEIVAGEREWFDLSPTGRRPARKRRCNPKRWKGGWI